MPASPPLEPNGGSARVSRNADAWLDLLACPRCAAGLVRDRDALACAACAATYPVVSRIAELRAVAEPRTERVRAFYSDAPFPNYPPNDTLSGLRARAARSDFARLLDRAIPGDARIVEVGCGTGQMSLFLATADRIVVGADLTRASLDLAVTAAARYGLRNVHFIETDLRAPGLRRGAFDVVYSSGVLHHTPDPRASFAALASLARPGGFVVLGLYNAYARIPHRARRLVARATGFRLIPFDPILRARDDEAERRRAWFRDQYLHPEEHRHTIAEVQSWFRESGVDYVRSYPNALLGSDPAEDETSLFEDAADDWGFENVVSQIAWARTLAHEGGLWVTIGRRAR